MTRKTQTGITIAVGLALGVVVGLLIPQNGIRGAVVSVADRLVGNVDDHNDHEDEAHDDPHDDEPEDLAVISKTAAQNLGLTTRRLKPGSYRSYRSIPSVIREQPAVSDMQVSTAYEAVVTKVLAVPGQAVKAGQSLFEVRLTGEKLAEAQSSLLSTIQQIENTNAKIGRLKGLATRAGGTAKRDVINLELEKTALQAQSRNQQQQLLVMGLTQTDVEQITNRKELVRVATIFAPEAGMDKTAGPDKNATEESSGASYKPDEWAFTIEDLHITTGATVQPGDALCEIAWHASLFIEGQAFEDDVELIRNQMLQKEPVPVELGSDDAPIRIPGKNILYVDNRVDDDSQTFRFYLPLENEIQGDLFDKNGRRFRSWRFKPGQRGHVLLPEDNFTDCFVLPPEAVTEDGSNAVVFRRFHSHGDDTEYEAVRVTILHRDSRAVVVAKGGQLKSGDRIVENRAYHLLLAMKAPTDGGGGHHDHDH